MTAALDIVLEEVTRGAGPPNVLLMRFLGEADSEAAARAALDRRLAAASGGERVRLERFAALWAANPRAWPVVRSVLAGASHAPAAVDPDAELRRWAAVFDRLAADAPEAGVALYALSNPALLAAATEEIVGLARTLGLLGPARDAIDLGCGIGRLAAALSPHLRSVLGTDIAAGMVAEARRRCAAFGNVRFLRTDGRDLAAVPAEAADLIVAADVMPYLVQVGGGLAAAHVAEFARLLRPGGAALVLNFSYRGDPALDQADLAGHAARAGLDVARAGTRDLALWDAPTFLLRKPAP